MSNPTMPDPGPVMQALSGYWVAGALRAALELDLFTHVGAGHDTPESLAEVADVTVRGTRALGNAMCALGFLEKEDGRYRLTPVADSYLRSDKPTFLGAFHRFMISEPFWQAFGKVSHAAKSGKAVFDRDAHTPDHEMWATFADSSLPMAMGTAMLLPPLVEASRPGLKILDLAAGSGAYGITLAQASPGSEVTFLDWPNVLDVTLRHAQMLGVADRARRLDGSAFELDWGGPYDIVVAGNFLHHFDQATCHGLIGRAREALTPGGIFATSEFVADEERRLPGMPLLFAVAMLVWTDGGDAYTATELKGMFEEGGLVDVSHHVFAGMPSSWVLGHRE